MQLFLFLLLLSLLVSFSSDCEHERIRARPRAPDAVGPWTRTHARENARQNARYRMPNRMSEYISEWQKECQNRCQIENLRYNVRVYARKNVRYYVRIYIYIYIIYIYILYIYIRINMYTSRWYVRNYVRIVCQGRVGALEVSANSFFRTGKWRWNPLKLAGGIPTPLKNMSSSVGMMKFPIYGGKNMFQSTNQCIYIYIYTPSGNLT